MNTFVRTTVAAAVSAVLLASAGACSSSSKSAAPASVPQPSLPAPRSAPSAAPFLDTPPTPGEVRLEQGPFTDRLSITGLTLTGEPSVTGHMVVTSDVSDVIALELRAAYYDDRGRLVGTTSFEYQEEGHAHTAETAAAEHEGIDFTIPATGLSGTPVTALVSVPVLVNE
ncbi:hypothetical protein LO772_32905 [Yinghuangia sp. ASG 101]|uniref:hypothetical protein n=1 Tax=Yinghuangia sp. ASG 101 TaxID=2896848 RepID=UPI001E632511|nr:hypothetical protein [Yinghuangia sp. ASG 101]UGQ11528.1 hypothetical protein LO772_32905 [Yinghuangia sp. ASG 101]